MAPAPTIAPGPTSLVLLPRMARSWELSSSLAWSINQKSEFKVLMSSIGCCEYMCWYTSLKDKQISTNYTSLEDKQISIKVFDDENIESCFGGCIASQAPEG